MRKMLGKYLTPETCDAALRQQDELGSLAPQRIGIILVAVRDDDPNDVQHAIKAVTHAAIDSNICVAHIISSLVILTTGMFPSPANVEPDQVAFVELLSATHGKTIKILHGTAHGDVGNLGSSKRFSFSFIVPDFLSALAELSELSYGEVRETDFKTKEAEHKSGR